MVMPVKATDKFCDKCYKPLNYIAVKSDTTLAFNPETGRFEGTSDGCVSFSCPRCKSELDYKKTEALRL